MVQFKNTHSYYRCLFGKLIIFLNLRFFLFFILFYIFFDIFGLNMYTANCAPNQLSFHKIGGHPVYFYSGFNYQSTFDLIKFIKYNSFNNLNYNIYMPNKVCINTFPYYHPLRHPHLNVVDFNGLLSNTYVNFQMSSKNFNNCNFLSNHNILDKNKVQFISNNFYIYEKNLVNAYFNKSINNEYLNFFCNDFSNNTKKVLSNHKI